MILTIREASPDDIDSIVELITPYVEKGILLPRSKEDISAHCTTFSVAVSSDKIAGVVSYYKYNDALFEIRSLVVDEPLHCTGIGKQLVAFAVENILSQHKQAAIFCLTYAPDFFQKAGFFPVAKETLPDKIWKDCQYCKHKDNCTETALIYAGVI